MVGDSQIGKTSLMVKYVEDSFEWVFVYVGSDRQRGLHTNIGSKLHGEDGGVERHRNHILSE